LWHCPRLAVAVIIAGWIRDNDDLARIREVDGSHPPKEEEETDAAPTLFPRFFLTTFLRVMTTLGAPNAAIVAIEAGRANVDHDRMLLDCDRRFNVGGTGVGVGVRVGIGVGVGIGIDCAATLGCAAVNSGIVIVDRGGGLHCSNQAVTAATTAREEKKLLVLPPTAATGVGVAAGLPPRKPKHKTEWQICWRPLPWHRRRCCHPGIRRTMTTFPHWPAPVVVAKTAWTRICLHPRQLCRPPSSSLPWVAWSLR
jgi:hypothetical protein